MKVLLQIAAVTRVGIESLPRRLGTSSLILVGMAGTVAVLVSILGLAKSLSGTVLQTGREDRAIILQSGAATESSSYLTIDAVNTIKDTPGIRRAADGTVVATADVLGNVLLTKKADGSRAGLSVRGVSPAMWMVRPQIKLVHGRMLTPGLPEVLVGTSARREFVGLTIGDRISMHNSDWTIVGEYTSHDAMESTLLADAATLLSAYRRTGANSVSVQLESADRFEAFKQALTTDPTLHVQVLRESAYYQRQSRNISSLLFLVTDFIGTIMAVGALLTAVNTMYSAVASRHLEIAILRTLGFGGGSVLTSVIAEAVLLSLTGALLGAAVAWFIFSGHVTSFGDESSLFVFEIKITALIAIEGVAVACVVGLFGGLIPAIRASRLSITAAMRQT